MNIRKTEASLKINNSEFDKAIAHFGTLYKLAQALDIKMPSIYKWESVPELRARQLEDLTKGKIKKEKLRPDLFT